MPRREPHGSWKSSLQRIFISFDRPFRFAAHLTSLGLVGIIVGAIIQYAAWRDEKNLDRHHQELSAAIAKFSEIAGALSSMMNLQQSLYFTYKNAAGYFGSIDPQTAIYLAANAKITHDEYAKSRTVLRTNIDVLGGNAELFIDRPAELDERRLKVGQVQTIRPVVISNRDVLRKSEFDCNKHMPDSKAKLHNMTLDWSSARDHVATLYFCLEETHSKLLPIRVWASLNKPIDENERKALSKETMDKIETEFNLQTERFIAFMAVAGRKIEIMRLRGIPNGFFCHQLASWFCDGYKN